MRLYLIISIYSNIDIDIASCHCFAIETYFITGARYHVDGSDRLDH